MNPFPVLLRLAAITAIVCSLAQADVTVSNVSSAQRVGTKLVDIDYNLAGSTPPFTVSVRVSSDDGVTFTVPTTSLAGAIGAGQTAGTNKRITWNAGVDWNGNYTPNMRFEVTATDTDTPPVVTGSFVLIPAGAFLMGDQSNPQVGRSNERPVHTVQVSAFYMGKHEVSWGLWKQVRDWARASGLGYTDLPDGAGKADDHPVHSIDWYAMVKWCNARSEKEGLTPSYTVVGSVYRSRFTDAVVCNWAANGYRLPTEAEWEKAARGGLIGKNFPWGDTITHSQANYCVLSEDGLTNGDSYDLTPRPGFFTYFYYHPTYADDPTYPGEETYTAPVTNFAPNGYGLFNMSDNVSEWCWDLFGDYTADSQTDPRSTSEWASDRVVRGGSWYSFASNARVADRGVHYSGYVSDALGFRTARSSIP